MISWWNAKAETDKRYIISAILIVFFVLVCRQNNFSFPFLEILDKLDTVEIIDVKSSFKASKIKRTETKYLVIHHAAGEQYMPNDTAFLKSIESDHIQKGFKTLAYHFVIIKDKIYQIHDIDEMIAGTYGYNSNTINICVIGDFELRKPTLEEQNALSGIITQLKTKTFPNATICYHKTLCKTSCCGRLLISQIDSLVNQLNKIK